MSETKKVFTWEDLIEVANKMPPEFRSQPVYAWAEEGEGGHVIKEIEILEEDFVFDGDEGSAPLSEMEKSVENWKEVKEDHPVLHKKGTVILIY